MPWGRPLYHNRRTTTKGHAERIAGVTEPLWALGLMTGTSMDGIDAALILSDGVLYSSKSLDLTERVLQYMEETKATGQ